MKRSSFDGEMTRRSFCRTTSGGVSSPMSHALRAAQCGLHANLHDPKTTIAGRRFRSALHLFVTAEQQICADDGKRRGRAIRDVYSRRDKAWRQAAPHSRPPDHVAAATVVAGGGPMNGGSVQSAGREAFAL
jgi:hypothetical protein